MQKCFFIILLFVLNQNNFAQIVLRGKVFDLNTGALLPFVSIYINNSSKGTTTNANGEYFLDNIAVSNFDIVASCVGYETYSITINKENLLKPFDIKLKPKSGELQAVIIQAYEKDGWNKWGQTFIENFIGSKHGGSDCKIKNFKAIKFVYNKKAQILFAYADEPLIIVNKDLGYEVKYDLQSFSTNFKTGLIYYEGYPFFTNIDASARKVTKWKSARVVAYFGSVLHFLRSIYRDRLQQEGFQIKVLVRYPNREKERVINKYKNLRLTGNGNIILQRNDSTDYFSSILNQSDSFDYVYPSAIKADSIAYLIDKTTVGISFKNYIQVTYSALYNSNYKNFYKQLRNTENKVSIISIINNAEIAVFSNGSYYNPANFFTQGYWIYSEKINNLLPVDYNINE